VLIHPGVLGISADDRAGTELPEAHIAYLPICVSRSQIGGQGAKALATASLIPAPRRSVASTLPLGPIKKIAGMPKTP